MQQCGLQHVATFSRHLAAYDGLADGTLLEQIRAPAAQLRGPRVMRIYATPAGGGVAEILRSFVPQHQAVDGVRARPGVDPRRPLMTQVSRFDRWKNRWQVVDVYHLAKRSVRELQLAICTPIQPRSDRRR